MFSIFSSTVHLHSKKIVFSNRPFFVRCHKVFSFIAITVPVHQRDTRIKLPDRQLVRRFRRFFSWSLRRKRKELTTLEMFLDLDGNMLISVLRKSF